MTINASVLNNGCPEGLGLKIVPIDENGNRLEDQARVLKGREFEPYVTLWKGRSFILEEVEVIQNPAC